MDGLGGGGEGQGFAIALSALDSGRLGIAACAIGVAQAARDEAVTALAEAVASSERLAFETSRVEAERLDAQKRADVALARLHESDATLAAVAEELGHYGSQARAARAEAGLTQAELAERLSTTQSAIARWESGRDVPRLDKFDQILRACGIDVGRDPTFHTVDFWTSHEALLLGYEEALTRRDSLTGRWYDCSAHMLWIGERTRDPDGAHVHFLSGVHNPIGLKLGPTATADEVVALAERLNPDNEPGRLTLIVRMGAALAPERLPQLVRDVTRRGVSAVWSCDPMHGNTFVSETGYKTRRFTDVLDELRTFFGLHEQEGTVPGGVHIELTGEDVTECLGGAQEIVDAHLSQRYESACDPRLNNQQSLELAFLVAEMLRR